MLGRQEVAFLENEVGKTLESIEPMVSTEVSDLYRLKTAENAYVAKKYATDGLEKIVRNQSAIYDVLEGEDELPFSVPEVLAVNQELSLVVMEYIEGEQLHEVLPDRTSEELESLFKRTGQALTEFQDKLTERVESLPVDTFPGNPLEREEEQMVIHGDFKSQNVLVTPGNELYLIDFSETASVVSYYRDLACFLNNSKVFSFVHAPGYYLRNRADIEALFEIFLENYGREVSEETLREYSERHRNAHVATTKEEHGIIKCIGLEAVYRTVV